MFGINGYGLVPAVEAARGLPNSSDTAGRHTCLMGLALLEMFARSCARQVPIWSRTGPSEGPACLKSRLKNSL